MWWVLVTVLAGTAGLGVVAVRLRRDRDILADLRALHEAGRHEQVLAHPLPARAWLEEARTIQVASAVRAGRFRTALDLLADAGDDGTWPSPTGPSTAAALRASSLVGLGRYRDVIRLLGDRPPRGPLLRLRAQAAVETGDDALALVLLADAATEPAEEAERLHLLGTLHLRRGRVAEGERMVRTARATFAGAPDDTSRADAAMCTTSLARARLERGQAAQALPLVRSALDGLALRPDDAARLGSAHALAGRVYSVLGEEEDARRELATAQAQAGRCESPRLDAELLRARGLVAYDLGELETARRLLGEALVAHLRFDARPVVDELRANLRILDGHASDERAGR